MSKGGQQKSLQKSRGWEKALGRGGRGGALPLRNREASVASPGRAGWHPQEGCVGASEDPGLYPGSKEQPRVGFWVDSDTHRFDRHLKSWLWGWVEDGWEGGKGAGKDHSQKAPAPDRA